MASRISDLKEYVFKKRYMELVSLLKSIEEAEPYEGGDPPFGEIAVTVQGGLLHVHTNLSSFLYFLVLFEWLT